MIPPAYEQNANSLAASDLDPKASKVQNILVATTDSGIRRSLTELLQNYSVKMLWAAGMETMNFCRSMMTRAAVGSSWVMGMLFLLGLEG